MKEKNKNPKILVIGDSCEDVYVYGRSDKIAIDTQSPVLVPSTESRNGGMSINVLNNIKALDIECSLISNKNPIIKKRYVDTNTNKVMLRVDTGEDNVDSIKNIKTLEFDNYDAIIISDYNKGFLSNDEIEYICNNHDLVVIDTKRGLGNYCKNATFIKVNEFEFEDSKHIIPELGIENSLITTLGSKGSRYKDKIYSVNKVNVENQTGAGDTFVATFTVHYLKTYNVINSIVFANKCSEDVVQRKGVCVVNIKNL